MGKKRRLKFIVVSSIVLAIIGYLTYTGIRDTMAYYLTVSELLARGPSGENVGLRVAGEVIPDSIQWNPKDLKLSFRIRGMSLNSSWPILEMGKGRPFGVGFLTVQKNFAVEPTD